MKADLLFSLCQYPLPHHLITRAAGWLADHQTPWLKNALIRRFIRLYNVDMQDAFEPAADRYINFNAFFTRALKEGARPLQGGLISPADGVLSQCGAITQGELIQAKGQYYTLANLLGGDEDEARPYANGSFATVYLSPSDYHRVHMPCAGTLRSTCYIPGRLFSVNHATTAHVSELFARNERLVCHFDTPYGPMALVLVGAMIVAGIETVWQGRYQPAHPEHAARQQFEDGEVTLSKGDEMGRFYLGSTVVACFSEKFNFSACKKDMKIRMVQTLDSADSADSKKLTSR